MPSKKPKLREDVAETAFRTLQELTGERPKTLPPDERTEKNPEAVRRGAVGGKRGGKARAAKLTKEQRSEIARKAARSRWTK